MKTFLYILGTIFLTAPIILWGLLGVFGCGMGNGANCSDLHRLIGYFLDPDFWLFAALPWLIAVVCFVFARRASSKASGTS